MTNREKEILKWIQENPLISQNELAKKAKITRSSVAVHISNLMKKGKISGKGYILPKEKTISIIGGANIDINATPKSPLIKYDSNIGTVNKSLGGVARNIAENLARLDINIEFITAFGNDSDGELLKKSCTDLGISIKNSITVENETTSTYISINDSNNDMYIAIASTDILKNLNCDYFKEKMEELNKSELILLDTNLSEKTLHFILSNATAPVFVEAVSSTKALKLKDNLHNIHTLKMNRIEAETLSSIKISDLSSLKKCTNFFIEHGVSQIFISLGKDGLYFANKNTNLHFPALKTNIINTSGAGDALFSGIIYSFLSNFAIEKSCQIANICAYLTLKVATTVNYNLNIDLIENTRRNLYETK